MSKRILITDDDHELCEEMAEILKVDGYNVDMEFDSLSCERALNKKKYDIFILDYKMPGLNGIEMLKLIKQREPQSKVFIISGKHNIKDMLQEDNLYNLVDGFLNKPFDVDEFLAKIKSVS